MVDFGNGRPLLGEQLARMERSRVSSEAHIVTGYLAEHIQTWASDQWQGHLALFTHYNPFFDIADNLMSLWLVRDQLFSDFIVTNGDNLFSSTVFLQLASHREPGIYLTTCRKTTYVVDDMKVLMERGLVKRVSKRIPVNSADAVSVGLALIIGEEFRHQFRQTLVRLARSPQAKNSYWLEVINTLVDSGVEVKAVEIDCVEWQELDDPDDLVEILSDNQQQT